MPDRPHRTIRSFVRRQGRMTNNQKTAINQLWPRYGIEFSQLPLDLNDLFGRSARKNIEIGFGMGDALLAMASAAPDEDFLGIEVYGPGVGHTLDQADQQALHNIRAIQHDAVDILNYQIPDNSIDTFNIFFPDPWHKRRHHKRRLIQPEFTTLLTQKLKANGLIRLATDWQNYAEQILNVLSNTPQLNNTAPDQAYTARPTMRPLTKFERRGQRLGHEVWDLCFIKT